jgi:hypothetical protein
MKRVFPVFYGVLIFYFWLFIGPAGWAREVNIPLKGNIQAFSGDQDEDGISDATDNCLIHVNPDQRDTDGDGFGNRCDADFDNNGQVSFHDLEHFRNVFNTSDLAADLDGNGYVSFSDLNIFRTLFGHAPGPGTTQPPSNKTIVLDLLKAFPTAMGAGSMVSGGRGGKVVYVTRRDDPGESNGYSDTNRPAPGTLQEAIYHADPSEHTTILFAVGGKFDTGGEDYFKNKKNITIAGQTAHDIGGVELTSSASTLTHGIYLSRGENFILRFISLHGRGEVLQSHESGKYLLSRKTELVIADSSRIIADHLTGGYSSYALSLFTYSYQSESESVSLNTVQNCLFHEGVGGHNVSGIIGVLEDPDGIDSIPDQEKFAYYNAIESRIDVIQNAFIQNSHRQLFNGVGGNKVELNYINNYTYGWHTRITNLRGGIKVNMINNLFEQNKTGDRLITQLHKIDFNMEKYFPSPWSATMKIYASGNQYLNHDESEIITDQWQAFSHYKSTSYGVENDPIDLIYQSSQPIPSQIAPDITTMSILPMQQVKEHVLSNVGAGVRFDQNGEIINVNGIDTRYINIAINKTGSEFWTENLYAPFDSPDGGIGDPNAWYWPEYKNSSRNLATYDSDLDGMPNSWEIKHGLDANSADNNEITLNWKNINNRYTLINNAGYTNLEIYLAEIAGDFHLLAKQ